MLSGPRRPQLRTRVLAGVLSITLIALAAFDVAAVTALHRYLLSQTDSQLRTVLGLYEPVLQPQPPTHKPGDGSPLKQKASSATATGQQAQKLPRSLDEYGVTFVSGQKTGILGGGVDLVPQLPADLSAIASSKRAQTVTGLTGQAQLRLLAVRSDGGILVATANLGGVSQTVGRLRLIVIFGSAAAWVLVALGVAYIVRRGLRPIETMAAQADRITAGDLTDRVSPQGAATEVGRLGAALNNMLARIEASIREREASQELTKRFFADASHELRTPLASLRANAELYQQGALPHRSQVDEAMHRIVLESKRMSRLVDDMLRLARLDQHPNQRHDPVDLTALVQACAERARVTDPERTWETHTAEGLVAAGDEEMLRRAIDNLLANVRAHTPRRTVATITAASRDSAVIIEVSDDGPGVPADQVPRLFDRFYRAAPAQHAGSGLGLAIVTAIAAAHDGTAEASLNQPHGLRITLTLPAGGRPGTALPQPGKARVSSA